MRTQSLTPLKANAHTELNATEGKCSYRTQRHLRQDLKQNKHKIIRMQHKFNTDIVKQLLDKSEAITEACSQTNKTPSSGPSKKTRYSNIGVSRCLHKL